MSERITVTVNETISKHVDTLLEQGIFGRTRADVVQRLICDRLIQLVQEDWLPQTYVPNFAVATILEGVGELKASVEELELGGAQLCRCGGSVAEGSRFCSQQCEDFQRKTGQAS